MKKYIILMSLLTLFSCNDFLEEEPTTNFSADFVYNTPEGLELGLVSLYTLNRSFYENGEWNFTIPMVLQSRSDLVFARGGEISLFARLVWGASTSDFGHRRFAHYWRTYYRVIDRANAVIKAAEGLDGIDESDRNRIIAEAKCFRARSYFMLYRIFNNIFISPGPTTPENAFNIVDARSSEAEIFQLINDDLDFAIDNLEWTTEEWGRFTRGAAHHMKAQVALWQGALVAGIVDGAGVYTGDGTLTGSADSYYQIAKEHAEEILPETSTTGSPHALVGATKEVFAGDLNHPEALFVVQYTPLIQGGGTPHRFNFLCLSQYGALPTGGAVWDNAQGGRGAAQLLMNEYFRELLAMDPNDDRDDNTYYISYYTYNDPGNLPEGVSLGDTIRTFDEHGDQTNRDSYYRYLNPACRKFLAEDGIPSEASQVKNIMVYRLAETYLIAAEANLRLGNTPTAIDQLNVIRTRANAAPVDNIDIQAILDEDARELGFEGKRWFTLKRLGVLVSHIQQYAGNDDNGEVRTDARTNIKPHMVNWPVPQPEMDLLGPDYPQNSGY